MCEMTSFSFPMNIAVAVEPDSSCTPSFSSLYKIKHNLNLQRDNIENRITPFTICPFFYNQKQSLHKENSTGIPI